MHVFDLNYFGDIFRAPHQLIQDKTASLIENELSFGSLVNGKVETGCDFMWHPE